MRSRIWTISRASTYTLVAYTGPHADAWLFANIVPGLETLADQHFAWEDCTRAWDDPTAGNLAWCAMSVGFLLVPFVGGAWLRLPARAVDALPLGTIGKADEIPEGFADFFRRVDIEGVPIKGLPDDAVLVVRGGKPGGTGFLARMMEDEAEGISVFSAPGRSVDDLAARISGSNLGVTTRGELRAAGAILVPDDVPHYLVFPGEGGAPSLAGIWRWIRR